MGRSAVIRDLCVQHHDPRNDGIFFILFGARPARKYHARRNAAPLAQRPYRRRCGGRFTAGTRKDARPLTRIRIHQQQSVDANRYNLQRRDIHFTPGDRVWVWTPVRRRGLTEKLMKRYFGPYKILRRIGDLNYEVKPDTARTASGRMPRSEVVHVVRLKPYYER